jgi:hypothetical protein
VGPLGIPDFSELHASAHRDKLLPQQRFFFIKKPGQLALPGNTSWAHLGFPIFPNCMPQRIGINFFPNNGFFS